jgi:hypothetical protein
MATATSSLSYSALQDSLDPHQFQFASCDLASRLAVALGGGDRIEGALEDNYLSRDPSTSKRAAYTAKRC